jgi:hypothetical protein
MGSTGSTWLAKLLNSHPDVYCSHEGLIQQVYPADYYESEDVLKFIEYFGWDRKHDAYLAVGDVGSVWMGHLFHLTSFTTAVLLRHPARLLRTRLEVYPRDQSFSSVPEESQTCIKEIWGIDMRKLEPLDQVFLHDAFVFAAQVRGLDRVRVVIHIEDMRDAEYCRRTLRDLTGLHYGSELIEKAIGIRINQGTGSQLPIPQILDEFSPRQRDWYNIMLADVLPELGYSPSCDRKSAGLRSVETPIGNNDLCAGNAS